VCKLWCKLKWGEIGGSTNYCVVASDSPRHDFRPIALLFSFEYFLDGLKNQAVGLLNHSIRRWVVYRCEGDLRPDLMAEILKHGTIKIFGVVDRDLLWNSIATDDVLLEKFLDGGGGYVAKRLHFNPFGEVLHCDYSEGVVSLHWCKFANDVSAPALQGPRWSDQLGRLC
jgi:hypothetical protein